MRKLFFLLTILFLIVIISNTNIALSMPQSNQGKSPNKGSNLADSQGNIVGKVVSITRSPRAFDGFGTGFAASETGVIAEINSESGILYVFVSMDENRLLQGIYKNEIVYTTNDCSGTPYISIEFTDGFFAFIPTVTGSKDFDTSNAIDTLFGAPLDTAFQI